MTAVLAVDVGGTSIKSAVVTADGVPVGARVPVTATGAEAVGQVLEAAAGIAGAATAHGLDLRAAGIVIPGIVDEVEAVARTSRNLGWRDVPIGALLEARLGMTVAVGHDIRAAALAEATLGAGRGFSTSLFVGIGTGIAAATITDRGVLTGAGGRAGEIGQLPLADGRILEQVASARAVERRYAEAGGDPATSASMVARLADEREPCAVRVWGETIDLLAWALEAAVTMVDPDVVILGGGMAHAGDHLLGPLRAALAARLGWRPPPPLHTATFVDQSACVGAAMLAGAVAGMAPFRVGPWE